MTDSQSTPVVNVPKPLPTEYAGHTFRSRLEARWAVFFDELSIEWIYEPEGYELPSGNYLPDFYLPAINGGCWFEVKGQRPTDLETQLAHELAQSTGHDAFIAWGQLPSRHTFTSDIYKHYADDGGWDNYHRWCCCPKCGKLGIEFAGKGGRICWHTTSDSEQTDTQPLFGRAYMAAASRRFWDPK
jgi:hypothetical protein